MAMYIATFQPIHVMGCIFSFLATVRLASNPADFVASEGSSQVGTFIFFANN